MTTRGAVGLVLICVGVLASAPAPAQELDRDINITTLRIPPGPDPLIGAEGTALTPPGRLVFSATLRWVDQPLGMVDASGDERLNLVRGRLALDLGLSVGVVRWLELAAFFPTVLYQNGENQGEGVDLPALAAGGTGDLRIRAKATIFSSANDGLGLGFVLEGSFPTGLAGGFLTDGNFSLDALVLADFRLLGWHLALALGYRTRPERELGNLYVNDEFLWRVGIRAALPRDFGILLDVTGAHGLLGPDGPFGAQDEGPILIHLGVDFPGRGDLRAVIGGGMGLTTGYGAPRFDLFASIRYAPRDHDTDGDGILDYRDRCLEIPEDYDEHLDEDGCPDEDNDGDGIPDLIDMCPDEAEDPDGYDDEDGCPDEDNDGDGLLDGDDRCPDEAEDPDGVRDDDGCPDPDSDGDGIDDVMDRCVEEAEDLDGFQDGDGCPDPDNDGDGVIDPQDECPEEAEDDDDFQDDDGCPELGGRLRRRPARR